LCGRILQAAARPGFESRILAQHARGSYRPREQLGGATRRVSPGIREKGQIRRSGASGLTFPILGVLIDDCIEVIAIEAASPAALAAQGKRMDRTGVGLVSPGGFSSGPVSGLTVVSLATCWGTSTG
jgi:hypothetical protein